MTTLEQLRRQFDTPCPTLAKVLEKYFPHITSEEYFLKKTRKGEITLRVSKAHGTRKAPNVVYLTDLATWLDAQNPSNTTAADQAA
jgi:hypothetical protein